MNPTQNQEVVDLLNENHQLKLGAKAFAGELTLVNAVLLAVAERHMTCTTNLDHDPGAAHAYETVRALFVAQQQRVDDEFRGQVEQEERDQDPDFQAFFQGYIDTMFFVDAGPDHKLPEGFGWSSLSAKERKDVEDDCWSFYQQNKETLEALIEEGLVRNGYTTHGHDFKLTRDGHGAGFWDRGYGSRGDELTKAAKPFGTEETLWFHHLEEEKAA